MYDYPMTPVVLYDPNIPPFVPNIQVVNDMVHILPLITSAVINEVGQKANTNVARMFCYNLLSSNNWQNQYFYEVVKLSIDYLTYNYRKNIYRIPEHGIMETVNQITTLYTSDLVFKDPSLKQRCSPDIINISMQNVPILNNIKQELTSFMQNPSMLTNMQQQFPQQQFYNPNMQPQFPQQQFPQQQFPQQQFPVMQSTIQNQMTGSRQVNNSCFYNPTTQNNPNNVQQVGRNYHNPSEVDIKQQSDFFNNTVNISGPVVEQQPVATNITDNSIGLITEGTVMNREQHTITVFEGAYSFDKNRLTELKKSVGHLDNDFPDESLMCLYPVTLFENNLDTVISVGRIKQIANQQEKSINNIFRIFSIIANPVITYYDVAPYMKIIKKSTGFAGLASSINSIISSLQAKSEKKNYTDSIMAFILQFDNTLVNIINDFLGNKLHLEVRIENFTTDIMELYTHLYSKHGNKYQAVFENLETSVIEILFQEVNAAIIEAIKDDLRVNQDGSKEFLTVIPTSCSITYTFMTNKELQYDSKKEFMVVTEESAPSLYLVISSLDISKRSIDFSTIDDYLITSDGVKYKIYGGINAKNEYRIKKN